jgi:hypothetical protein
MPTEQPSRSGKRPKDTENEPQLSADEAREILHSLKPVKPEDRLPEGKTIITLIPRLKPRKGR